MPNIEEELALFEKELSSLESEKPDPVNVDSTVSVTSAVPVSVPGAVHPSVAVSTNVTTQPLGPPAPAPPLVSGPILPNGGILRPAPVPVLPNLGPMAPSIRPRPPPMPDMVMQAAFLNSQHNLAMRFIPPQLRLLPPNLLRPPMQPLPQPTVLESGPSLYETATNSGESEKEKEPEPSSSTMKSQVLSSDMELVAQKKHSEAANKSSYLGQVLRGEKKMKRFLRCGGGQVWEDNSLAEWDPNDFRIFCGDLGNEVSDELLAKAFRKYPSFQKAKVIREARTNKSKGYGFVSFKHQDDFVRACREMDGKYVGNRPIKLRKSNWKERSMEVVKKKQKQKQKLGLA